MGRGFLSENSDKSRRVEIEVTLVYQTGSAVRVRTDDTSEEGVWLPKSLCAMDPGDAEIGDSLTLTLPYWLAADKGLI